MIFVDNQMIKVRKVKKTPLFSINSYKNADKDFLH